MARVYADVNQQMPRSFWDYENVNIVWGELEHYEVVRKIGKLKGHFLLSVRTVCVIP
jgi:casein kinase II subunit alpha